MAGVVIGAAVAAAVGAFLLRPWQESGHVRSMAVPTKDEPMQRLRQENARLTAEQQRLRQTVSKLSRRTPVAQAAQPRVPTTMADSVRTAFLFQFVKFIEWPAETFPNADTPVVIGVLGEDRFGNALDLAVHGKTAKDRPIRIVRAATVDDLRDCHILFISDSEQPRLEQIFAALHGRAVATVGEMPDFIERGGLINFIQTDNHIRFQINPNRPKWPRLPENLLKLSASR